MYKVNTTETVRVVGLDGKTYPARRGGKEERNIKIRKLHKQGLSMNAIAKLMDCSRPTVWRAINH